ncbi:isocitrate/isopropylmalate dehydrogenase [Cryobacterium sp. CAN_C3]|nr:isocitrate/isopropylmalate dehydrogenase [Cryobacterium sp. CAN_C3]
MFEAIHGSAPDIAGRGWANPIGAVLSTAMCLAHLGDGAAARAVEAAAVHLLAQLPSTAGPAMGFPTQQLGREIAGLVKNGATVPAVPGHSIMDDLADLSSGR